MDDPARHRRRRALAGAWLLGAALLGAPALAGAASASTKAAAYYEDALVRYNKGDIATAIIQLKNVLQLDPESVSAYILLGKAYVDQGQGDAAESELKVANRLGADRALTIVPLAKAYIQQYKFNELATEIDPTAFSGKVAVNLWLFRGEALLELGEIQKADEAFRTAGRLDPEAAGPMVGQAKVLLQKGDGEGAMRLADIALARAPNNVEAWNIKGSVNHAMGNAEGALEGYGKVISLDPDQIDVRIARAGLLIDLGRYAEAQKDLSYVAKKFPFDPRAPYMQGVILDHEGKTEAAKAAYQGAAVIVDQLKPALFVRRPKLSFVAGLVDYTLGRYEKAESHLKPFLNRHPDNPGARKILGAIALAKGEPGRAATELEKALPSAPRDYRLLTMLGTAYMRMGDHRRATVMLEKATELSGGATSVKYQLALTQLQTGEMGSAIDELTSIISQDQHDTRAGLVLAVLHMKRGEYAKAAAVAKELVARDPGNETFLNILASAQAAKGDNAAARVSFEKVLALDSKFFPAVVNLAKLDLLDGKPAQAEAHLAEALKLRPDDPDALIELGRVEQARGDLGKAARWLEKARTAEGNRVKARLALVNLYLRMSRPKDALAVAKEAEDKAPDSAEVMIAEARCHLALGRPDLAQVIYQREASRAGFDTALLYRLAGLQLEAGASKDALWSLEKATKGDPSFLPAQIALVEGQLRFGNRELARDRATSLRDQYPDKGVGYRLLGDVQMADGNFTGAAQSYQTSLAKEPRSKTAIRAHEALRRAGKVAEADKLLTDWLSTHPDDTVAKAALAEAYMRDGKDDKARTLYEQVLAVWPTAPSVLNNLAYLYDKAGDPRALAHAEQAQKLAPNDAVINDTLGWILVHQGKPASGLRYLRNAHALASTNGEIRYHIAAALDALGRRDEARLEIQAALEGPAAFDGLEQAKALQKRLAQ